MLTEQIWSRERGKDAGAFLLTYEGIPSNSIRNYFLSLNPSPEIILQWALYREHENYAPLLDAFLHSLTPKNVYLLVLWNLYVNTHPLDILQTHFYLQSRTFIFNG